MSTISAIIVAAGRGIRAGGEIPKQYQLLGGRPILLHSINAMLAHRDISNVTVVINAHDAELYESVSKQLDDPRLKAPVIGGETRSDSVMTGLNSISSDLVLIHDGARPLLPYSALDRLINTLADKPAAFLALPVTDALWSVEGSNAINVMERDKYWRAQTPQGFRTKDIINAHTTAHGPTGDDVEMARVYGLDVAPVIGSDRNLKITHADDFALAEKLLGQKMDIRTGNGFDVHALGKGDHVILNGIKIPHTHAMIGHSDADVAMHAITDALFGALAEGDIGQWFPPSDNQWKGASSDIFLTKSVQRCSERGFKINHIDCTIICEMPKIGPHSTAMRENLASIIGIDLDRISVKATTSEKLGFTGRGEGIAAQATATLVKT